jgi:ribosomal protein L11 methyltransferase
MNDVSPTTSIARLAADRTTAERLAHALSESFGDAAVSASEAADGWLVEIFFPEPPVAEDVRAEVARFAGQAAASALTFEAIAQRDWVAASLAGLAPVQAGRFVVHGAHDRARIGAHRIGIEIEAALAFGTGHHGTTRGCLVALDGLLKTRTPRHVLDIGTGTGVLAIAAAAATHRNVVASDIDATSVRVGRDNARLNNMLPFVEFLHARGAISPGIRARGPYDLIFANILLLPVMRLAVPIARLAAPDARVVLSGLLRPQANAALAAYRAQQFHLERRIVLEGWATLVLRRSRA